MKEWWCLIAQQDEDIGGNGKCPENNKCEQDDPMKAYILSPDLVGLDGAKAHNDNDEGYEIENDQGY